MPPGGTQEARAGKWHPLPCLVLQPAMHHTIIKSATIGCLSVHLLHSSAMGVWRPLIPHLGQGPVLGV